jgi:hypothetical protein
MGLSVLEAASVGVKYLDCDRTPGCIYGIALIHSSLTYILSPSSVISGTFVPIYTLRYQTSRIVRSELS